MTWVVAVEADGAAEGTGGAETVAPPALQAPTMAPTAAIEMRELAMRRIGALLEITSSSGSSSDRAEDGQLR
jgi:hypothetical protein